MGARTWLGVGLLAGGLLAWLRSATEEPAPSSPKPPVPGLRRLDSLTTRRGGRYLAAVVVHAPTSLFASAEKVRDQAVAAGFRDVSVTEGRPVSWPSSVKADYCVEATATSSRTFPAEYGGGQVQIVEAWERT